MEVRVLFFAAHRDAWGAPELVAALPPGATVADLVGQLRARDEGRRALPPDPAVAVNRKYASLATPLSDGDEVALIPPVAGG